MKNFSVKILVLFTVIVLLLPQFIFAQFNDSLFVAMKARSIGPASMSGRIGAIAAVPTEPDIIYVGAATGGLWKSIDGGTTWKPVFDDQPVSSIGAIAINQANPDIVWVGTGEAAPRNTAGVGRGVYLTLDGARTWKFLGLEKTEKISKIILDPNDPRAAYVAAMGTTWGKNPERGVFKTTDGGKTWKKVLFVDQKTGVSDLAMDPKNPNKLIAGMWQHRRWPWFFKSGGPGSGLYITVDGGENWQKITVKEGIPKGELGRIGIAFSINKPEIVYALVEAKKSVLLRSDDGGYHWKTINKSSDVGNRPFYYHRLWVNPVNENIVYLLHSRMMVSEDGGKSFRSLTNFGQAHSDFHAMWLHPNGEMMIVGNDGGVVVSYNRGKSWRFVENLPIGQFYHISFDMATPYNVYGGLQDNGSWMGPGYVLKERAIYNYLWKTVGGGDGFDTEPDPEKPGAGYGMSQGGSLYYFDTATGTSRSIVPTESDVKHRYNWNAGFAVDPFHPATIYLGSQFVHRSKNKGKTWEIISPDLTTNNPEKEKQAESGGLTLDVTNAENHCTILCIAPSPVKEGVIWVTTDDGNVQLTRDNGQTWQLVSKKITSGKKGMAPPATWSPHIEASKFYAATAYVVFDDHRRANWTPYLFVTHDYGKSWQSLVTPEIDGFIHVIEEDPVDKNLLFLGTEFGMYVSFNGGGNWMKWTQGLPTVPVRDIAVQPRENDLIIATHGRSLYIIDDISPLRRLSKELMARKLYLFPVANAVEFQRGRMSSYLSPGDTQFTGENKQMGAGFTYYLIPGKKKKKNGAQSEKILQNSRQMGGGMGQFRRMGMMGRGSSRVKITIYDADGKFVSTVKSTETKGLNRVYWNFREQDPQDTTRSGRARMSAGQQRRSFRFRMNMTALPGVYTVKIKYNGREVSRNFTIKTDPRFHIDRAILRTNYKRGKSAQKLGKVISSAGEQIEATKKAIQTVMEVARAGRAGETSKIVRSARDLDKKLKKLSDILHPEPPKQGIADRSAGLRTQVMRAVRMIAGAGIYPVSQAAEVKYEKVQKPVDEFLAKYNDFYQTDVAAFKKLLEESGFSLFKPFKPLKMEK